MATKIFSRIESGHLGEQGLRIGMIGSCENIIGRIHLDHTSQIHNHHAITQMPYHAEIVADE